jgi:hypothetical protein
MAEACQELTQVKRRNVELADERDRAAKRFCLTAFVVFIPTPHNLVCRAKLNKKAYLDIATSTKMKNLKKKMYR